MLVNISSAYAMTNDLVFQCSKDWMMLILLLFLKSFEAIVLVNSAVC